MLSQVSSCTAYQQHRKDPGKIKNHTLYGRWDGVHSSGVATQSKYYGTYDFNKDNKIISGSDFFDLGGLMNVVQPKNK